VTTPPQSAHEFLLIVRHDRTGQREEMRRLAVNGHDGYPPIPIVWGISATIARFKEAMADADADKSRRALPAVTVDGFRVQESGLVKDAVVLDIPAEAGNFDTVLVRRAARKLRESSDRWQHYATTQGSSEIVRPLLVLQAPNTPDADQLGRVVVQAVGGSSPLAHPSQVASSARSRLALGDPKY
jgi:hypothetical protein